ncbi:glutamate receptor ionotropic, delta-1 [Trichonephila clavipes]|uniref:Glutamate receptor ionotropic, delta-1 n=1 Tax=Trichonephila clavipes TaxID=2585209 RepID=A0A8X6WLE8_TRICX|nr:glutamate receptor ionotropic, delta-1 [Trichonephila clavipes]
MNNHNNTSLDIIFGYELKRPPDQSWGGFNGKEWTGMIRMLVKKQADAALSGMTVTYDRYSAVHFSIPYAFDRITFVTKKPSRKPKTWAIFWPYTLQVWIFLALSVLMVSVFMTLLRNAFKSPKSYKEQFKDTALYMFQALLSQGYYNASEIRCRILMAFWWIFCITVVAGYNGSLMSFMAHPGYNPSLDTVPQLVSAIRNRNFAVGTIQNSADYTVFRGCFIELAETSYLQKYYSIFNLLKYTGTDHSDEAHFWLNGYVNKQNCRIWRSEASPQVYVETPLHPEKLTVWCALWAGGILLQKR